MYTCIHCGPISVPFRSISDLSGPISVDFGPFWSISVHFGPFWSISVNSVIRATNALGVTNYRNGPKWTEMDRNGPKWTEMDRNGTEMVLKWTNMGLK